MKRRVGKPEFILPKKAFGTGGRSLVFLPFDQSLDWILNRETSKEISLEGNALATGGGMA
ncbi:hypothetical protein E6H13_03780 [Candidatus Bathyarchaeota archaeon]|nr:MAG: hypothetical protein E6H13_03780 [Candidatus Bathyarchaeota archaeon]